MSDQPKEKKRGKGKLVLSILAVLLLALVGGAFGIGIIKMPNCTPAIQSEVDWPPDDFGVYEERSHNALRILRPAGFSPPGTVSLCDVDDGAAADAVALVPDTPRFLVFLEDQTGVEYVVFHSVNVPPTHTCVGAREANVLEGVTVTPDADDPRQVWVEVPSLDPEQTYLLGFGTDRLEGMAFRIGTGE